MKIAISTNRKEGSYRWIIDLDKVSLQEILYCINEQYPIEPEKWNWNPRRRTWE